MKQQKSGTNKKVYQKTESSEWEKKTISGEWAIQDHADRVLKFFTITGLLQDQLEIQMRNLVKTINVSLKVGTWSLCSTSKKLQVSSTLFQSHLSIQVQDSKDLQPSCKVFT